MQNRENYIPSQLLINKKFHFFNKSYDSLVDPFDVLNVRFKKTYHISDVDNFVYKYNLTAAECYFLAHLLKVKKNVKDFEIYYHCTDEDLVRMSNGAFTCTLTFKRVRKKFIKLGFITTTHKYNTRRVKGNLPHRRTNYILNYSLLKQEGITKRALLKAARIKSSKFRQAYEEIILPKAKETLRKRKLATLLRVSQKKNVTTKYLKNIVYNNYNQNLANLAVYKKQTYEEYISKQYNGREDFTDKRINREKSIKSFTGKQISFVRNESSVKGILGNMARNMNKCWDKRTLDLPSQKSYDNDLDQALANFGNLIKQNR